MNKLLFVFLIPTLLTSLSAVKYDYGEIHPIVFNTNEEFQQSLVDEYNKSMRTPFRDRLGELESSNDYTAINGSYYGKYQFGYLALKDVGLGNISTTTFLNSPEIQEDAMTRWLAINKLYLDRYIDEYVGTIREGIFITEAGILASAHLGGSTSVKIWFDTGRVFRDGNGTPITKYMKEFENFNWVEI